MKFETTSWSTIIAAQAPTKSSKEALSDLCQTYWEPLYAYVRARGSSREEAEDLTQGFFLLLLETDFLKAVDREKGRFRAFLLASMNNFLRNQHSKRQALKRGSGQNPISLDFAAAERMRLLLARSDVTPESIFERRWALRILEGVLNTIESEYKKLGNAQEFELLKPLLVSKKGTMSYADIADALGKTESAIKVSVHRLRRKYRDLIREEIGRTVSSPEEIDDEFQYLLASLSHSG